jgi:hypothetical protein
VIPQRSQDQTRNDIPPLGQIQGGFDFSSETELDDSAAQIDKDPPLPVPATYCRHIREPVSIPQQMLR